MTSSLQYVSFGGVSLACSTPELEAEVNRLLALDGRKDWDAWNFTAAGTSPGSIPNPSIPVAPPIRTGVLHWPADATRPAWFYAVVNQTQLNAINAVYTGPAEPLDLILRDGRADAMISAKMSMLPPRPISQLGLPDTLPTNGWLLAFTDQRFWWQWRSGSITERPTSWLDLYDKIGLILGRDITVEAIDSAYGDPTDKWIGYLRPPATVLDAIAASVGQRIVVALDGTVRAVNWETAKQESDDQWELFLPQAMGGYIPSDEIGKYVPESLNIAGVDKTESGPNGEVVPYTETVDLTTLAITEYGDATGVAGATSTVFVDFEYTGPSDDSAWAALVEAAGTDWYGWRLADLDIAFPGIVAWGPTGWEDFVEWMAKLTEPWIDESNPHEPLISTAIRRPPFSDFPSTIYPTSGSRSSYIVKLTSRGAGIEGGTAWAGKIQIVDPDTGAVTDNGYIGADPNTPTYCMYETAAADGGDGNPEPLDRVVAIPDKDLAGVWEFIPKKLNDSGGDCSSCDWVEDLPTTACWRFLRRGGEGRCSCFGYDSDNERGIIATYDSAIGGWRGDGMVDTCCGCGNIYLLLNQTTPLSSTLNITGVHVSCQTDSGGEGEVFSINLKAQCCGRLEDGRKFIQFSGKGADSCSGTQADCGNVYRMIAICGAPCPSDVCDCGPCGSSTTPDFWLTAVPITGFPDNNWNGDWTWTRNEDDSCLWEADCNGYQSSLTFVPGSPVGSWVLTHGTAVYELVYANGQCATLNNSFTKVSGDGPGTLAVGAIIREHVVECCGGVTLSDLPATMVVNVDAGGSCPLLTGSWTVTQVAHDHWEFNDFGPGDRVTAVDVNCTNGQFTMSVIGRCGADPVGATFIGTPDVVNYDPLYIRWNTGVVTGSTVGCCEGGGSASGWIGTGTTIPDTWDCAAGVCTLKTDGTGEFFTLAACETACGVNSTYDCIDGLCTENAEGAGAYPSLAACIAAPCSGPPDPPSCCGYGPADHPNLLLTIQNGAYAGSYTMLWSAMAIGWYQVGLSVADVIVRCSGGTWRMQFGVTRTFNSSASACSPLAVVFTDPTLLSLFGTTLPVLVSLE